MSSLRIAIIELKGNYATVDGSHPALMTMMSVTCVGWTFCDAPAPKFASVPAIDPVAAEVDGGEVADNPSESIIVRRFRCTQLKPNSDTRDLDAMLLKTSNNRQTY